MMKFRRTFRLALLLAFSVGLASCGSDTNNNVSFRVIQASPDLPLVNFLVDGTILRALVDYKDGTGFLTVTPQTYAFAVEAFLPSVDGPLINVPLMPPVQKSLAAGMDYTFITYGKEATITYGEGEEATGTVQSLIIENVTEDVPQDKARLQFLHTAPDVPGVLDIYFTAVPTPPALLPDLSPADLMAQMTYGEPTARQLVLPGNYVIRVTLAGSTIPVFESGEILLSNGNDFLIIAVDNSAAGPSPISLVVNTGFRARYLPVGTFPILDKDTTSELRVVHVSPDAPDLDVVGTPVTKTSPEVTFTNSVNPLGIVLDSANGRALTVDNRLRAVVAVDLQSGARTILSDSVTPNALNPLSSPVGIALDSANGRALVVDDRLRAVVAVDLQSGTRTILSDSITPNALNLLSGPAGIVLDSANGRALVTDAGLRAVVAVDLQTGARTILSDSIVPNALYPLSGPVGIVLDVPNGRALVTDAGLRAVVAVDLQTGARTILSNDDRPTRPAPIPPATTGVPINPLNSPAGIVLDSANGRALVADAGLRAVVAVDLQSGVRTILSNSAIPDGVNPWGNPWGIALDNANGQALVVDNSLGAVVTVNLQNGVRTILANNVPPHSLTYLGSTNYVSVLPAVSYTLQGYDALNASSATRPFPSSITTPAIGGRKTALVAGLLATIDDLVLAGDIRPVFAEVKLRIVDASPSSHTVENPNVDVYILPPGKIYTDVGVLPTLSKLALDNFTTVLLKPLATGNYTVTFTKSGIKTSYLAQREVAATGNTVQTAVLVDAARVNSDGTPNGSDGTPPDVLLLDDLSP